MYEVSSSTILSSAICSIVSTKFYNTMACFVNTQYYKFLMNNHCFTNVSMDWPVFIY
jgi:hypothetical protein